LGQSKTLNSSLKAPNLTQSNLHQTHPFGAIERHPIWHNQTIIKPIHLVQLKAPNLAQSNLHQTHPFGAIKGFISTQFCTIKTFIKPIHLMQSKPSLKDGIGRDD
jgi:hypothetical protein